jgi:uncharacterized protein (TIGR00661 family)
LISNRIIFISPLDWGLGHASRCVSIIHDLENNNNSIIIGVTPLNAFFFTQYFPHLQKIEVPSYKISFSKYLPLWLKLLLQWPKINSIIKKEKKILEKIILHYKIDLVISDNRFGLYNKNVKCIFVTHQLNLKAPFFSLFANRINQKFIHRFNEVWVPDYEDENLRLSGQLSDSDNIKIPVKYIGPKSALENVEPETSNEKFDYLILLSGIEPQRSILEKLLLEKFAGSTQTIVLVRGSNNDLKMQNRKIKILDFAFGRELAHLIVNSETVICRSGYSSLMDLHALRKKKLILIPTPGQTEQEYLADVWKKKFNARVFKQKKNALEF